MKNIENLHEILSYIHYNIHIPVNHLHKTNLTVTIIVCYLTPVWSIFFFFFWTQEPAKYCTHDQWIVGAMSGSCRQLLSIHTVHPKNNGGTFFKQNRYPSIVKLADFFGLQTETVCNKYADVLFFFYIWPLKNKERKTPNNIVNL